MGIGFLLYGLIADAHFSQIGDEKNSDDRRGSGSEEAPLTEPIVVWWTAMQDHLS
ncbi:hypothetical protein [Mesorhizobium sp. B2-8-3]|uniref:hypothetical protein n=1 Tax=Mesorhizobium sp. B2-8-3 TaxID=2589905 RepID=UPI0015E43FD4|nr:hypothetical protein [Mesorhizobium sp. B2-8-3]